MLANGEISAKTVKEWDRASKGKKLPERVKKKAAIQQEKTNKEKHVNIKCGAFERVFFRMAPSASQEELAERVAVFTHLAHNDKTAAERCADVTDEQITAAFAKRAKNLTLGERLTFQFAPHDHFAQG